MGTITTIASFFHTTYESIDAHLREHTDGIGSSPMLRNPSAVKQRGARLVQDALQ